MNRLTKKLGNGCYVDTERPDQEMWSSTYRCLDKLGKLEDIEEEFSNYNIDMILFLKHVLDELKQRPTLEISNFNPEFKILRNDFN